MGRKKDSLKKLFDIVWNRVVCLQFRMIKMMASLWMDLWINREYRSGAIFLCAKAKHRTIES